MSHIPSKELLEATHSFPGPYTFKVIGLAQSEFESSVLGELAKKLGPTSNVSKRLSADGKHLALTIEIQVVSADEVREIYEKLIIAPKVVLLL